MQSPDENGLKERGGKKTSRAYLANEDVIAAALANRMKVLVLPAPVLWRVLCPPLPTTYLNSSKGITKKKAHFGQRRRAPQCRLG